MQGSNKINFELIKPAGVVEPVFLSAKKRKPHKMVKYTQTIHRQIADELFE